MTQLLKVLIDSIDVTERVSSCNVSEEMNRIYDVATLIIDDSSDTLLDKEVIIYYGDRNFTGFVYSRSKTGKNSHRVECRSESAKLTEPYSPYETVVDDATTSHELCALFASESGIPITITSEDIDFGGSYERSGTMLSALLNVASVTGAEYYNDNGTVKIVPNKAITTTGAEIPESNIFDYVSDGISVYNKGVGFITVKNGGDVSSDVISLNKIYVEVDECTAETFVYPNPNGELEHIVGVSPLSAIVIERKEEQALLDIDIVNLNGAIESIEKVTLNGSEISNYNFEQGHNVLYFTSVVRGTLEVFYSAYCYKGYANIKSTPLGRFISFDMYYLDQVLKFQGFLSSAADCASNMATDGDMTCIVPNDLYYNKGFYAWTIGGDPEFVFYNKTSIIIREVITTSEDYTSVESATLEKTETGYRYQTRFELGTANGVRSGGEDIAYTTSYDSEADAYYFEFTQYYPRVEVSYDTPAQKHWIQFSKIEDGIITLTILNKNSDEICEYELDWEIPCDWNQYVPIDVASELGLEVSEVKGHTLYWLDPDGASGSDDVDSFGILKVWENKNGDYIIDTSSLKPRTTITLTVAV